jgi:putative ABC transport system permease protein
LLLEFFAGITAASSDMQHSSDKYYDDYNYMDIRMVSTAGFTQDDIDSIKEVDGLSGVFATHTIDTLTVANNTEEVVKVMTVPDGSLDSDNPEYINQLRLKEGRLPESDDECVVRWELSKENIYNIGDTITLQTATCQKVLIYKNLKL